MIKVVSTKTTGTIKITSAGSDNTIQTYSTQNGVNQVQSTTNEAYYYYSKACESANSANDSAEKAKHYYNLTKDLKFQSDWSEEDDTNSAYIQNKPVIGDGTITITQGGTTKGTFTTNQSGNTVIELGKYDDVDQLFDGTSNNAQSGTAIAGKLAEYVLSSSLASVAISGSYNDLTNKPATLTVGNGTLTITQDGSTLGMFEANQNTNTTIDIPVSGASRNIGEIVASTLPLTDAGLHLLDGALIDGSGIYSDFVDYISSLDLTANYFCTEAEWQQSVTDYGVCGKFVYDSTNNTVRLPKITGILEGTTDVTALGSLVEAGLPNITGGVNNVTFDSYATSNVYGAFNSITDISNATEGSSSAERHCNITFDASNSSSIYGNSTTVQPQTIKAFYYIVIANSTKTEIQVDIDEIATDLNGKADVDLSNVPTSKGILTESYVNGTSWYRVYSDGWCEQGGVSPSGADQATVTITLLKAFSNTSYTVASVQRDGPAGNYTNGLRIVNYSTNSFQINYRTGGTATAYWVAYGYTN